MKPTEVSTREGSSVLITGIQKGNSSKYNDARNVSDRSIKRGLVKHKLTFNSITYAVTYVSCVLDKMIRVSEVTDRYISIAIRVKVLLFP